MNGKNDSQLTAKFFTKNKKFEIPDNPFSIPTSSNPETFSSLIKSILKTSENEENNNDLNEDLMSTEFDFYINKEFVHTTLGQFIKENEDIKTESVIEIEYVERCPPPEPIDTLIIDDWVSSIRGLNKYILVGSYNNNVQIWNIDRECLTKLTGHTGAVKTVDWISSDDDLNIKDKTLRLLSGSQDQSIIIWDWNQAQDKVMKTQKCIGHTESVECLDVNGNKTKFISGSWDKMLKLWSLEEEDFGDENNGQTNKKSKSDVPTTVKTPIMTLAGHTESISSCKWIDDKTACTGSWDHSIKLWDLFTGQETRTLKSSNKIFLSIDHSKLNNLIVAGLNDNHVRIYDPKSKEGNIVKFTLTSHTGWCSSVFWSRTNENMLISGSYDNLAKLWDLRNTKAPIFEMVGHEDKILCVDWSIKNMILTGSADNTFKMYATSDIMN